MQGRRYLKHGISIKQLSPAGNYGCLQIIVGGICNLFLRQVSDQSYNVVVMENTLDQALEPSTPVATTNVRHIVPMSFGRIQRYLTAKMKQAEVAKSLQSEAVSVAVASFFVFRRTGCAPG